jgi:hypothetical protein
MKETKVEVGCILGTSEIFFAPKKEGAGEK